MSEPTILIFKTTHNILLFFIFSAIMQPMKSQSEIWSRRRDIPLTVLAWIVVLGISIWVLSHFSQTVIIFLIAAFLAYALAPAVGFFMKYMPRSVAILLTYTVVLVSISVILYLVISTALEQFSFLSKNLSSLIAFESHNPILRTLQNFGITQSQLIALEDQLTSQAEHLTESILPILSSVFAFLLDMLIVAILSIYLLIDGSKLKKQIEANTPRSQKHRLQFLLTTSQYIIGNYIRGQIFLSVIIGLLVGFGMALFHVPYALLLGVIASLFAFIPILGTLISGVLCVLLALTQGWIVSVFVLIYFIVVHIIEGDILGPRIVGKAIGLHPLVSILALIAGSELYGILGALFAAPLAGLVQAIIIAIWTEWRATHPDEFKRGRTKIMTSLLSSKR